MIYRILLYRDKIGQLFRNYQKIGGKDNFSEFSILINDLDRACVNNCCDQKATDHVLTLFNQMFPPTDAGEQNFQKYCKALK